MARKRVVVGFEGVSPAAPARLYKTWVAVDLQQKPRVGQKYFLALANALCQVVGDRAVGLSVFLLKLFLISFS